MERIGLDLPFLLLPFRPASDPSAARTFVRNFFGPDSLSSRPPRGEVLSQELRLTEPLVDSFNSYKIHEADPHRFCAVS